MSFTKCRSCSSRVHKKAETCPKCLTKDPVAKGWPVFHFVWMGIGTVMMLLAIYAVCNKETFETIKSLF